MTKQKLHNFYFQGFFNTTRLFGCVEADFFQFSSCGICQHLKILFVFFQATLQQINKFWKIKSKEHNKSKFGKTN